MSCQSRRTALVLANGPIVPLCAQRPRKHDGLDPLSPE